MESITTDAIEDAVQRAFAAGVGEKRYIDVSRIPLICQSIVGIGTRLASIDEKLEKNFVTKDQFGPVKAIVYGAASIILTTVFGALIALVIIST